jgi:hypothetical protein
VQYRSEVQISSMREVKHSSSQPKSTKHTLRCEEGLQPPYMWTSLQVNCIYMIKLLEGKFAQTFKIFPFFYVTEDSSRLCSLLAVKSSLCTPTLFP